MKANTAERLIPKYSTAKLEPHVGFGGATNTFPRSKKKVVFMPKQGFTSLGRTYGLHVKSQRCSILCEDLMLRSHTSQKSTFFQIQPTERSEVSKASLSFALDLSLL